MKKYNKIVGIGFHKTGTSSLRSALEILGFKVLGDRIDLADDIKNDNFINIFNLIKKYDAFEDNPWAVIYKEIDINFPNSKYILTIRNEKNWIKSIVSHFGNSSTPMRELIYGDGNGDPIGKEILYVKKYQEHIKEVKEYFKKRPDDLLVLSFENGDGWNEICEFLSCEVPEIDFPHVNKAKFRKIRKFLKKINFGKLFSK